jgi:GNAT superfamily N-acetyltransferase
MCPTSGPFIMKVARGGLTMNEPTVVLTDVPDHSDIDVIGQGLAAFNDSQTGIKDRRLLAVLVKDASGTTVGGISGRSSLGLLFLDLVYLPEPLRGGGLGSRLLAMAEEEGRRRGCKSAVLYTISFQAPEFYKRHGWRVFGEIACDPPGTSRVFMTKELYR